MCLLLRKTASLAWLITAFALASSGSLMPRQSTFGCLSTLESQFGKSIVATPLLYEVTSEYGMEIQLGKDCDILQILVGPKFFWNEHVSGWVEPEHRVSLPLAQYEEILRKIEQLKPLGALIKTTRNLFVTNSKVHYWDEYETG